jgi:hypothetical protein
MTQVLVGGDPRECARIRGWLEAWGLSATPLAAGEHPAGVPRERACAVLHAGALRGPSPRPAVPASLAAPLILVGEVDDDALAPLAWERVARPGADGDALAAVLRPCLDAAVARGCRGPDFRDFLNHELRTPLTAAGMALQTLALQLEHAGGPSLDLVDTALRNIRRLEQTVEWATDYVADEGATPAAGQEPPRLIELLEDLDDLDADLDLVWSTGVGDWQAPARLPRDDWRRLLRQLVRAVAYRGGATAIDLSVSTVADETGLLLVFQLPTSNGRGDLADSDEEQLRRLLSFTVHPELARRLGLRYDVVRTASCLRLRVLLPLMASDDRSARLQPA